MNKTTKEAQNSEVKEGDIIEIVEEPNLYKDYTSLKSSIGKLQKSGVNPHFKNTYVELNTVLELVDNALSEHNFLCFIQTPINIDGKNYLHTKLIHSTGDMIESDIELITTRQDPQMLGSSMTYARRYSLITMLGLQAVDDDGNSGAGHETEKEKQARLAKEEKQAKLAKIKAMSDYIKLKKEELGKCKTIKEVEDIRTACQKMLINKPEEMQDLNGYIDAKASEFE